MRPFEENELNHLRHLEKLYENQRPAFEFDATTTEEWKKWKSNLTAKLLELLGGFPAPSDDLSVKITEKTEKDGYVMEKLYYQSEPDVYVPAYLLIPSESTENTSRFKAVLALHGHGRGVSDVLGIGTEEETDRYVRPMNYDYAIELVKRGFLVLAPEMRGFGERRDEIDRRKGPEFSSCRQMAYNSMMLGRNIIAYRVFDIIRGVDYLMTRTDVDPDGIGCFGLSHGGTLTTFASVFDERIKSSVVSGYVNTFKDSIMSIRHCDCNYIQGILKYAELYDIVSLIAPRPLLVQHGLEDPIFPIDAATFAFGRIQRVYDLLGVSQNAEMNVFRGGHRFNGEKAFDWIERHL